VGVSDFELVVKTGEANLSSFHQLLVKFSNKKEKNDYAIVCSSLKVMAVLGGETLPSNTELNNWFHRL